MSTFIHNFWLAFPLFFLVALGYFFTKVKLVAPAMGAALSKFSFTVSLPCLLFKLMSGIGSLPSPDWKIVIAFFGSCFLVFFIGRVFSKRIFQLNGEDQTIFGMAGVFSNNVQLGVPISVALLGNEAMPSIAVIFSLNAFLMWVLVTVAIEMSRSKSPQIGKTIVEGIIRTLKNPIIVGIILGGMWSLTSFALPDPLQKGVDLMAGAASPLALFAVGVGLTQYSVKSGLKLSASISVLKLAVQPLIVFFLAQLLDLDWQATRAACLLACLPVGVNVYIMAQEFNALKAVAANSLLITTALSTVTLPLIMTCFGLL